MSNINPLCIIYSKPKPNLILNTITNLIHSQSYKDVYYHICVYVEKHDTDRANIIKNIISNQYADFLDNRKITIDIIYEDIDMVDICKNPINLRYNLFIPIDVNNFYNNNYLENIIKQFKESDIDILQLDALQTIDSSGYGLDNNVVGKNLIFNKAVLEKVKTKYANMLYESLDVKIKNIKTNTYLSYFVGLKQKYVFVENSFKLLYLNEKPNSDYLLNSSYVFLYNKNNKAFNIDNNTYGIIKKNEDQLIVVDWYINTIGYKTHTYEFDELTNTYNSI